jgi:hypothetical protein
MKHFFIGSCLVALVASGTVAQAGSTLELISGNGGGVLQVYTNSPATFNFSLLAGTPTVTDLVLGFDMKKNHEFDVPLAVSLYNALGGTGTVLAQLTLPSADFTTGFKQATLDLGAVNLSAGNYSIKFASTTGANDDKYMIKSGNLGTTSDMASHVKVDDAGGSSTTSTIPNVTPNTTTLPTPDVIISVPNPAPTPEPGTVALLAGGGWALTALRRRKK